MSLWVYKRDKNGKRRLCQIDFEPMTIIILIGLLAALLGPRLHRNPWFLLNFISILPFVLVSTGLVCLIISKISLYRKEIWLSFGSGLMSKGYATIYKVAYVLIGMGVLLLLMLFNAILKS
jgi:hypothetical protein